MPLSRFAVLSFGFSVFVATAVGQAPMAGELKGLELKPQEAPLGAAGLAKVKVLPGLSRLATVTITTPSVCYALRSYVFKRDDATSDSMRFSGSSTCQSSTQFQAKNIMGTVVPRLR